MTPEQIEAAAREISPHLNWLSEDNGLEIAARALAAADAAGWQPIETAPRDGMYLVTNRLRQVCPIQYRSGEGVICNHVGFADWTYGEPVTAWRPLPTAPEAAR